MLAKRDDRTIEDVREVIFKEFDVKELSSVKARTLKWVPCCSRKVIDK
ncbi:hypothetical protein [Methanococcoides vulcani]|nr:hypothetical protein [Methanococcoides vulcani]